MKIAVISTKFLEDYVKQIFQLMPYDCTMDFYTYKDFLHAGDLYLELMDSYDGFLVSGPVPRAAICHRAPDLPKPLVSFGSNALCYYETFFKIQYEEDDFFFEKGYFDLLEWKESSRPLYSYLEKGTFNELIHDIYNNTASYSLDQLRKLEASILEKHMRLWKQGVINYSVTRFSNIMPDLLNAGIKAYFVYPHKDILQESLTNLLQDIHLKTMFKNQIAIAELGNTQNSTFAPSSQTLSSDFPDKENDIIEFAKKFGQSPSSTKRLLSALKTLDCGHISALSLASTLGITSRSANRILKRLLECGVAQILPDQHLALRGRPEKFYQLQIKN